MAKRYVEECDLCKDEAELDNTLTIKPSKGKKSGRSYDLCDRCKELLEKAFISRDGMATLSTVIPVPKTEAPRISENENILKLPDGTTREIPTREQIASGSEDVEEEEGGSSNCLHMNRTPPRITAESKGKITVQCKDCGQKIPYKSARQKAMQLNVKADEGISLKDHPSEERRR